MLEKGRKRTRKASPPKPSAPQVTESSGAGTRVAPSQAAASPAPARPAAMAGTAARPGPISPEERRRMIAEAAYFRAQHRGFRGGDPDRDWIEAESEIDAVLLERR